MENRKKGDRQVITLESIEQKRELIKKKKRLRGREERIEDDLVTGFTVEITLFPQTHRSQSPMLSPNSIFRQSLSPLKVEIVRLILPSLFCFRLPPPGTRTSPLDTGHRHDLATEHRTPSGPRRWTQDHSLLDHTAHSFPKISGKDYAMSTRNDFLIYGKIITNALFCTFNDFTLN